MTAPRLHPRTSRHPAPATAPAAALLLLALLSPSCPGSSNRDPVYSGTIEAVEVDIVPEVSGRILERPVDQGDQVQAGALIARIDPEPYRIALAEAEGALASARASVKLLEAGYRVEEIEAAAREVDEAVAQWTQAEARIARVEDLVAGKVAAPDDLDLARRDRDVAAARVAAAGERLSLVRRGYRPEEIDRARAEVVRLEAARDKARLDFARTELRSPVAGTVTHKLQEPGEYARPGSPIVTVADLVNLYTWVYLGEADLPKVRLGDSASVRVDAFPGKDFPGKIVYVSQEAEFTPKNVQTPEDRVQLVHGVKVAVSNPDGVLKIGIPADVVLALRGAP